MPRKILIIGGANGVGRATTEQLLAQTNDELIVIDRDQKKLSEIQARAKRNFEKYLGLEPHAKDRRSILYYLNEMAAGRRA